MIYESETEIGNQLYLSPCLNAKNARERKENAKRKPIKQEASSIYKIHDSRLTIRTHLSTDNGICLVIPTASSLQNSAFRARLNATLYPVDP
jgi:hypothetical protein